MTTASLWLLLGLCAFVEPLPQGPVAVDLTGYSRSVLGKDSNNAGRHIGVDLQEKTSERGARWSRPLLNVPRVVNDFGTIQKLRKLYGSGGQNAADVKEFLRAIVSTDVMQYTMNYLRNTGKFSGTDRDFEELLRKLWFTEYRKGGETSSAFRHVFMAEKKPGNNGDIVNGFHNWLYFAHQQDNNKVKYRGWHDHKIFADKLGGVASLRFEWDNAYKSYGTMFMGTSPELEMALYTTCFLTANRAQADCAMDLSGHRVNIKAIPYNDRYNGNLILTAFPEI